MTNIPYELFDSTLRDGAQGEGISFSVQDKLKICRLLDDLEISYIEAGNPGSNPKDMEFFAQLPELELKHAKIVAFGSTRRRDIQVEDDANVVSLLQANTPVVAIFGKSWDFQVTDVIRTTLEENLRMIRDTMRYMKEHGKEVIFDAEHFFDGWYANKDYAMQALGAAVEGGASVLCLCETRGGMLPWQVKEATEAVVKAFGSSGIRIGIHVHDDSGCGVANSLEAVRAGAVHIQGTLLGFGERCGNANLSTIMADMQLKMGLPVISDEAMSQLTSVSRALAETANVRIPGNTPYIGKSAFCHKGGMHIDGVNKNPASFEHIDPSFVGNERRLVTSEVSGRAMVLKKIQSFAPDLDKDAPEAFALITELKQLESDGYQYEGADGSFDLLVRKHLGQYKPFFFINHYQTTGMLLDTGLGQNEPHTAVVKVSVNGISAITAAEGNGPVNALDLALRKVLEQFYPTLKQVHLIDYKVRVLDSKSATGAKVRVLIETTDGMDSWSTVGVSRDIIQASWLALVDSIEYKLIKDGVMPTDDLQGGA